MTTKLAIIIPAYKKTFLKKTLESIKDQTCKDFHVYIGDDNSPDTLYEIIKPYEEHIPLTYTKFPDNLGSISLVKQWERCIALSKNEEWLWLFSDDDMMANNCVEQFYKEFKIHNKIKLFRFPLNIIDKDEKIISKIFQPEIESGLSLVKEYLNGKRFLTMVEHIFHNDLYKKNGIVEFPAAWYSDIATWFSFSRNLNIKTIQGAIVNWRLSSQNISSSNNLFYAQKKQANVKFLYWLVNFENDNQIKLPITQWYLKVLKQQKKYSLNEIWIECTRISKLRAENRIFLFFKLLNVLNHPLQVLIRPIRLIIKYKLKYNR